MVRRGGRFGWTLLLEDVAYYDIVMVWGRPYLIVVPHTMPPRENRSLLFLGGRLPPGCVAGPIDPDLMADFVARFAGSNPSVKSAAAVR